MEHLVLIQYHRQVVTDSQQCCFLLIDLAYQIVTTQLPNGHKRETNLELFHFKL